MSRARRLALVLAINLTMVLSLLLVGLLAHSLGVLAAGADYLGDALGAGLSLVALELHRRRGRSRAPLAAALFNSSFLLLVTVVVAVAATHRLISGSPEVHGAPVIVISVVAAGAMIVCALILGDVAGDLSMESVMLDTVADAAAAIGVAVTGTVILIAHGVYGLDSLVALLIAIVVGYHALRLMRRALRELRAPPEGAPPAPRRLKSASRAGPAASSASTRGSRLSSFEDLRGIAS
jgi:cobalt-zinc-cadmium efflux system protein